jgi:hypothetical protein
LTLVLCESSRRLRRDPGKEEGFNKEDAEKAGTEATETDGAIASICLRLGVKVFQQVLLKESFASVFPGLNAVYAWL